MKNNDISKAVIVIILLTVCIKLFGQYQNESCYSLKSKTQSRFYLGSKKSGIGFGCFGIYNGLNLNFIDKTCSLNGIGISFLGPLNSRKHSNGVELSLAHNLLNVNGVSLGLLAGIVEYNANGIQIAGFIGEYGTVRGINVVAGINLCETINGFSMTGLYMVANQHNGLGVSLLAHKIDEAARGLFITGLIFNSEKLNGFSISPINTNKRTNGIQLGLFNHSEQLNGIQIGLINKVNENPIFFRTLPILNFNFSKDPDQKMRVDTIIKSSGEIAKYFTEYYPSGKLKSEILETSKETIFINELFENGNLKHIEYYSNDTLINRYYYKNGNLKFETKFINGDYLGNYLLFNKKGKVIEERNPNIFYPKKRRRFYFKNMFMKKRVSKVQ